MTRCPSDPTAVYDALLHDIHRMQPSELPQLLRRHCSALGVEHISIYMADVQQEILIALPGDVPALSQVPIDSSLPGRVYRSLSERVTVSDSGALAMWLPLIDDIERLGVLRVETDTLDSETLQRCRTLATLVTLILMAKGYSSDFFARSRRTKQMEVSAEMLWTSMPPRSIGTRLATSSAILQSAYDLGGDAFDHAITDHTLHATVIDGMGHDLPAGLSSSVALAACRNARRSPDSSTSLAPLVHTVDQVLSDAFDDRYVTGVFAHLHLDSGKLDWVNAGHPPPLLLRGGDLIAQALEHEPEPPLGLPPGVADTPRTLHQAQLEPEDRVLVHTDGLTDAKDACGQRFGIARFTDFVLRAIAADEPAPETLRRLIKTILKHQQGGLTDDATVMMFQWHPAHTPDLFT